jgi:DNA-binding CsgD family transcriptional regulator
MGSYLTDRETQDTAMRQIFSLEDHLFKGATNLNDAGNIIPGAMMIHDYSTVQVTYMNDWGCNKLNHTKDEINDMGKDYFARFFKPEHIESFIPAMTSLYNRKDETELYSFFHQVRTATEPDWNWYFGISKFFRRPGTNNLGELIVIAHPIAGMGNMINKVTKTLDENEYIVKHYKNFALLTKREKEIINLLCIGKNTADIAEMLFISQHTIKTHRKNINKKLGISNYAQLIRFGMAFNLVQCLIAFFDLSLFESCVVLT